MPRYAIIEGGIVRNVAEAVAEFGAAQGWVASETAAIGDLYDTATGTFSRLPVSQQVPPLVTMRQARLALLAAGKLNAVAAAIAALPQPQRSAAEIEWEFSSVVERNRPFVLQLGAALGLNDAALDALFIAAAAL